MEQGIQATPVLERRWRVLLLLAAALAMTAAVLIGSGPALLSQVLSEMLNQSLAILALVLFTCLPGLAVLRLLWPAQLAIDQTTQLALAPAFSLALTPLLLLLFHVLGIAWGSLATWLYLLVSLGLLLGAWLRSRRIGQAADLAASGLTDSGLLAGLTLATFAVRLSSVQGLPTGLLGDSYHHTLITQLLIDQRGLFESWQPYAPLASFSYHFGFHANAALLHWSSGVSSSAAVLLSGQWHNALVVPLLYGLSRLLGGSGRQGLWAGLIGGFVTNYPPYYVYNGRYTQLAGMLVLCAVLAAWIGLGRAIAQQARPGLSDMRAHWRLILLSSLATTGILLTHYLVTVFAALFVVSYLLLLFLARRDWQLGLRLLLPAISVALLALLLSAPWFRNVFDSYLLRNTRGFFDGSVSAERIAQYAALPPLVPLYANRAVLAGGLAGLLVAAWRQDWHNALPGLWSLLLVVCVIPYFLGLPGSGLIDFLTGLSPLYLPLALLSANAIARLEAGFRQLLQRARLGWLSLLLSGLAALALIGWGSTWQSRLNDGRTQLVTSADLAAMDWIRGNTPADARFLVNAFPVYGGTLYAGTDAGWWIPLLSARQNSLPPITYGSELPADPDLWLKTTRLYNLLRESDQRDLAAYQVNLDRQAALAALHDAGIEYVYMGATAFPPPGAADRFDLERLRASPAFKLVYEQDGVQIFELQPAQE